MKYLINIPNPCNENWNKMSSSEKGKFCSKCKKEILDLSKKSNFELVDKLKINQNVCGRFSPNQLNIVLNPNQKSVFHKTSFYLTLLTLLGISTPIFAKQNFIKTENIFPLKTRINLVENETDKDSIIIKGIIFDSLNNEPIPGVNIKYDKKIVLSDFDGKFEFKIHKKKYSKNNPLIFYSLGYENKEVFISKNDEYLTVKMDYEEILMGEVVIVRKRNIFEKIGDLFKRNENKTCN